MDTDLRQNKSLGGFHLARQNLMELTVLGLMRMVLGQNPPGHWRLPSRQAEFDGTHSLRLDAHGSRTKPPGHKPRQNPPDKNPPRQKTPRQKPPRQNPQSKFFVFHFLKIFMVHNLLIVQWLPVGWWFLKNLLLHIHVIVIEEFKSTLV